MGQNFLVWQYALSVTVFQHGFIGLIEIDQHDNANFHRHTRQRDKADADRDGEVEAFQIINHILPTIARGRVPMMMATSQNCGS